MHWSNDRSAVRAGTASDLSCWIPSEWHPARTHSSLSLAVSNRVIACCWKTAWTAMARPAMQRAMTQAWELAAGGAELGHRDLGNRHRPFT